MDAQQRLEAVQSGLQKDGVHDVKFYFEPGLHNRVSNEVGEHVANFLEAYLDGKYTTVAKIGDMPQ